MRTAKLVAAVACVLLLPGAAVVAQVPLTVTKAGLGPGLPFSLTWGPDPAFPAFALYDVIEGDLPTLMTPIAPVLPGDYTVAVTACLLEDGPLPPPALVLVPPPAPPAVGQNFYLVLAQAGAAVCGGASWNEPLAQVGTRDPEIPADPASCPCP